MEIIRLKLSLKVINKTEEKRPKMAVKNYLIKSRPIGRLFYVMAKFTNSTVYTKFKAPCQGAHSRHQHGSTGR